MKKLFYFTLVSLTALAGLSSCGNGKSAEPTPEQLDSIARAVGPDSVLNKIKDAKYAAVTLRGFCAPDTTLVFVKAANDSVFSTNVIKIGDAWTGINTEAAAQMDALTDTAWTALNNAFTPEAKAVKGESKSLAEIVKDNAKAIAAATAELNAIANSVYRGKWQGLVGGELATKMQKGQRMFFSYEYGTDGDASVAGVSLTPTDSEKGEFNAVMKVRYVSYDGTSYYTKTGKVRFEKVDGKYVMVSSTNAHYSPGAP